MSSFEEWWYSTQFDKEYWDEHKYKHITEYEWAKAGFKAGMLRVAEIAVVSIVQDTLNNNNNNNGVRVTLERQDGKQFIVNIPNDCWGDGATYGLNLVYGRGAHYT